MTNQIFRITPEEIHIDNLILQLSSKCAKNCKGCYVKAHQNQGSDLIKFEFIDLFELFISNKHPNYSANQISISVDEVGDVNQILVLRDILVNHYKAWNESYKKDTKIHLTMYSPSTIDYYAKYMLLDNFSQVDSIYFSNILDEEVDIIKILRSQNKNLEIGYNCWMNGQIKKTNLDQVDSIYFIQDKSQRDWPCVSVHRSDKIKWITDICTIDYSNWKKDWHHATCSANISKFTIWPDGSVSGCSYAKVSNTGPAGSCKDILNNIVEANREYDFNHCPLNGIYK